MMIKDKYKLLDYLVSHCDKNNNYFVTKDFFYKFPTKPDALRMLEELKSEGLIDTVNSKGLIHIYSRGMMYRSDKRKSVLISFIKYMATYIAGIVSGVLIALIYSALMG